MRVYADSCIGIYLVEARNPWHDLVRLALDDPAAPELCVSDLVRLECRVGPLISGSLSVLASYDGFLNGAVHLAMPGPCSTWQPNCKRPRA
jgi:hypothetical protein